MIVGLLILGKLKENKKAKLSWNTFLSLLLVFIKNPETDRLLNILEIYTDELNNELKLRL